jgi:60 kDa SS-A/Ro ribonucleoprotein
MDALTGFNLRSTPQEEQADTRQVANSAGGYTFTVDPMERLRRFLILGTDGGTYYIGQRELTVQNAQFLLDLVNKRGVDVVNEIVAVSDAGRAPKNNQALFALAVATTSTDVETRQAAYKALPHVARTGTHLFQFVRYTQQLRGWSNGLRKAVGRWYTSRSPEQAAYQIAKYGSREGWTHRDVLRTAHPKPPTPEHDAVFKWAVGKEVSNEHLAKVAVASDMAKVADSPTETARLIREFGLSWEMVKTEHLNDRKVWEALLQRGMGVTALIRQLPRLTNLGLLADKTWRDLVTDQLTDVETLRKGRIHPINILVAMRTYGQGHGERSSNTWTPVGKVVDALDEAFYKAFRTVTPSSTRHLIALDVSGSMGSPVNGLPLTCREASAAMAMVTVATESDVTVVGFTGGAGGWRNSWYSGQIQDRGTKDNLTVLDLSDRRRLDDNVRTITGLPFGGTDCALPMLWALEQGRQFDSFSIWTDSETWAGSMHPHQALSRYRAQTGIDAKLVVAGMAATDFTIADPSDRGMLDVVGLDAAVPNLVSDFFRGDI